MKITPLEIRQKSFEKHFRGYDKDEVNAFLLTLSQEWERLVDENKELRIKLEAAEKEVLKLREVETSLFKTLKTAEDTGANVIEQARQAADLHLRESQLKADAILNEAKMKAGNTIDEAEQRSKNVLVEMEDRLRGLVEDYKKLELSHEDLLLQLKRVSDDTIERVERVRKSKEKFDADQLLAQTRREIKKVIFPNIDQGHSVAKQEPIRSTPPKETVAEKPETPVTQPPVVERKPVVSEPRPKITSFFDEIG